MSYDDTDHKLDRNQRTMNDNNERLRDQIAAISEKVAVVSSQMEGVRETLKSGFATVDATFKDITSRYATTSDVNKVKEELAEVRRNLSKGVWIVLGAVIVGILTLVFKAGLIK